MSKVALFITLLIIPMLAMISEAVTTDRNNDPIRTWDYGFPRIQTTSSGSEIISTNTQKGQAPLRVSFDSIIDNKQGNNTYLWNFGDGEVNQGKTVSHAFSTPGEYLTTLTITDQNDISTEHRIKITVTRDTEKI